MISTLIVTGGGSAGHVVPAIPVVERFVSQGVRVVFVGSRSGLESGLLSHLGVEYVGIVTGKLRRYFSFRNLLDAVRVPIGICQAVWIVGRLRPDVVFSKGGHVGFPLVMASWLLRIPVVAHESDLSPGLANRISAPFVSTLCVNFPETRAKARRVVVTGTPLREQVLSGERDRGIRWLGFHEKLPILCVVGGSLGAERLNQALRSALSSLGDMVQIVHVCGASRLDPSLESRAGYRQFEFIGEQWGDVLAASDLVVSRAGANSLCELIALRKPHLLVPLTTAASRGDQIENAQMAERRGYSRVLHEQSLSSESLAEAVRDMLSSLSHWREAMRQGETWNGTDRVVQEISRAAVQN